MRVYTPREVLFASSYCVAKDLCDEQRFEKNIVGPLEELRVLGGDGLFTAHNHEHNWERTLVCYVTSKKLESVALARARSFQGWHWERACQAPADHVSQWLIDC
jgi:hypothetical protein